MRFELHGNWPIHGGATLVPTGTILEGLPPRWNGHVLPLPLPLDAMALDDEAATKLRSWYPTSCTSSNTAPRSPSGVNRWPASPSPDPDRSPPRSPRSAASPVPPTTRTARAMHKPLTTTRPEHHPPRGREETRRQFALVLRPTPDCPDVIKALRWGLKGLLRKHNLRCVSILEIPADDSSGVSHGRSETSS
jgi:hypothetical protein